MSIGDREALQKERRSGEGGQTGNSGLSLFVLEGNSGNSSTNLERVTNRIMNDHEWFCARCLDDILSG